MQNPQFGHCARERRSDRMLSENPPSNFDEQGAAAGPHLHI